MLQEDRRRRVIVADSNIGGLLEASRFKELWYHLALWYLQARGKQAQPTREGLEQELADRVEL